MIEMRSVYKKFAGQDEFLFEGACFKVGSGELAVVSGSAGSGKSTLLRLISAREFPTRGNVLIRSKETTAINADEMPFFRRQIGEYSQEIDLVEDLSVLENMVLPLVIRDAKKKFIQETGLSMLQALSLSLKAHNRCSLLTNAEKHLLRIGRAIIAQPSIILCDDPFAGSDDNKNRQIVDLLWRARLNGSTIVVSTNETHYFAKKPRRQWLIRAGKLFENNTTQFPSSY